MPAEASGRNGGTSFNGDVIALRPHHGAADSRGRVIVWFMARPPRTSAIALRYAPEAPFKDLAPRLIAKADGLLAERIIALARQHGIPVARDPDLLAALAPLELDTLIPPDLFKAVAIMLAAIYRANGQGAH